MNSHPPATPVLRLLERPARMAAVRQPARSATPLPWWRRLLGLGTPQSR